MSGYVVRKLQASGKYGSVEFLAVKDPDVVDGADHESTDWIKLIDHGGLVHVTDECYQLFISIEYAIRRCMQDRETMSYS